MSDVVDKITHCLQCGKPLSKIQIVKRGKFCSHKCSEKNRTIHPIIHTHCVGCGNPLPELQIQKRAKYCSRYCYREDFVPGYNADLLFDDNFTAYFTGLFITDGHLKKKDRSVIITSKDYQLIKMLTTKLEFTGKISKRVYKKENRKDTYSFALFGKISEYIRSLGYKPGKKKVEELFIPQNISDKNFHHFLRGVFDGDGSITVVEPYKYLNIVITNNSKKLLQDILDYLKSKNIVSGGSLFKRNDSDVKAHAKRYAVSFYHNDSVAIGAFVYQDVGVRLDRKFDVYMEHKDRVMKSEQMKGKICKIEGCEEPAQAKNLCGAHYRRDYYLNHKEQYAESKRKSRTKKKAEQQATP